MLPFQLDEPLCMGNAGSKFREGSGHSNLTRPFVGKAGVKFREGCCHFNLTRAFVWAMQGQNLEKEVAIPT